MQGERPLYWVGSSLEDLRAFPETVIDVMGYALHLAQQGGKHPDAKPLKGFPGGSVLEITADYESDTCIPKEIKVRYQDTEAAYQYVKQATKACTGTP